MLPALGSALITGGATLAGGLLANDENKREAERNRNFQMMMSNTAHQREIADLKAAGLNPLLSGTGGAGASTPSGSMATVENAVAPAVASAQAGTRLAQDIKQSNENIKLTQAQTNKANMETKVMSKDLPKADLLNILYEKAKGAFQTGAKSFQEGYENAKKSDSVKKHQIIIPRLR